MSVCLYIWASMHPPYGYLEPLRDLEGTDGCTHRCTDVKMYRFPLYSTTELYLLWFPSEPLPCSHNRYRYKIPKQGKGNDDHLLPLGDWFSYKNQDFKTEAGRS